MKKNLLAVLLFSAALTVEATERGNGAQAFSSSANFINALGGSSSARATGLGGSATSNPSQAQSTSTVVSTRYEDFPVNTAIANPAHTTAPCRAGVGVGAQGRFFGFSIGGSTEDKECEARMWAETWQAMGQPQAAVEAACKSEMNKGLTICQPK